MRWFLRFVVTTVIGLSSAIVALDSSSLPEAGWWKPPGGLTFAAIVCIFFGVIWGYIDAESERRSIRQRDSIMSAVQRLSTPVWRKLEGAVRNRKPNSPGRSRKVSDRVGLHVWIVPMWHWNVVPDWLRRRVPEKVRAKWGTPPMWRATLIRMKDGHDATQIAWRRDVGAIGIAWRRRRHVSYDLATQWGATEIQPQVWATMSDTDRLGLTHDQYLAVRAKYASVLVAPIFQNPDEAGSRIIGCIVIDSLADFPVNLEVRRFKNLAFLLAREVSTALRSAA